jgi:hypothetical protein
MKDADRLIKRLMDVQARYPIPKFRPIYEMTVDDALDEVRRWRESLKDSWTTTRPDSVGFYWVRKNNKTRIVNIWESQGRLFTNEDGGTPIEDYIYDESYWYGPIEVPDFEEGSTT